MLPPVEFYLKSQYIARVRSRRTVNYLFGRFAGS